MNTLNWKVDFWQPWREVGFLALVASEMSWVALWYNALSRITRPVSFLRIFFTLSLMLVVAHFLARLLIAIQLKTVVRRAIYGGAMLFSLLASLQWLVYSPRRFSPIGILNQTFRGFADLNILPVDFWVILLVLLVWRRGVTLARNPIASDTVIRSFQFGVLALFVFGILFVGISPRVILPGLYLFILSGLLAMSATRIATVGYSPGGVMPRFNRQWTTGIGITAGLVVLVSLLAAAFFRDEVIELIIRGLMFLVGGIIALLGVISMPVVLVVFWVSSWLRDHLQIDITPFKAVVDLMNRMRDILPKVDEEAVQEVMRVIQRSKPVLLWGVIFLVGLGVILALNWKRWFSLPGRSEDGEIVSAGEDWWINLRAAFQKRWDELAGGVNLRRAQRYILAARVRMIYRQFMDLCEDLDRPRAPSVTPFEFIPQVAECFPDQSADLQLITEAYSRVRYGELPETPEDVQGAENAWARIQEAGKRELSEKKRIRELINSLPHKRD